MTASRPRRDLARFGRRGRSVRVFIERGHELVRAQWRVRGMLRSESWPNTAENRARAKAFAEAMAEELRDDRETPRTRPEHTIAELWKLFVADHFEHLAANTKRNYTDNWRYFELYVGRGFLADRVTLSMLAGLRKELAARQLSVSTQRASIATVKLVWKWAARHELIEMNRLRDYEFRMSKEQRLAVEQGAPGEYRAEEFRALLDELDPESATQWRAYVTLALCGYQGRRQHAVLHLQVEDVDLEAGTVRWRAEWDKVGRERTDPLRAGARAAIEVALKWHMKMKYEGPWLLPAANRRNTEPTYALRSFWWALRQAEQRAGITHTTNRAGHGLRRMLAGDVSELLGDPVAGLHAIGDTDIRQAKRYIKQRDDKLERAFRELDEREQSGPESGAGKDAKPLTKQAEE